MRENYESYARILQSVPIILKRTLEDILLKITSKLEVDPLRGRKNIKSGSMIVKLDRLTNSQKDRFILSLKLKKMAKKSVFTRIDRVNTRNEAENIQISHFPWTSSLTQ